MTQLLTYATSIDELDLTRCIIGPDLVAEIGKDRVTIYRHYGAQLELVGTYEGPAAALAMIDEIDAGIAARQRYAAPAGVN